ncbi:hypothetical protein A7A08_00365 [Methyloligella halotolerans]|uniref:ACR n=1 Tax=Methyloligella halotolerans TaxID=1177755 RepID=A0A1E2S228_9HYPH|nr:DUF192 domain-containing protein [Methyloligella halotolerans]ODA68537.1 hypothetical protein A7A08_00365 [Methyloligella halotolerans]
MAFSARIIAAMLFLGLAAIYPVPHASAMGTGRLVLTTETGTYPFAVEVTETEAEQAKGLMFRRDLAPDEGMLFLYDEPHQITMWMKNTYLSLDMVFIGENWRVNRIAERTEPFALDQIPSNGPAIGVLEVAAGTARRIGLKVGDAVIFEAGR